MYGTMDHAYTDTQAAQRIQRKIEMQPACFLQQCSASMIVCVSLPSSSTAEDLLQPAGQDSTSRALLRK